MSVEFQVTFVCVSLTLLIMIVAIGFRTLRYIDTIIQILIEQLKVNSSLLNIVSHQRKQESEVIVFPEDPSVGDVHVHKNIEYIFDGVKWVVKSRK